MFAKIRHHKLFATVIIRNRNNFHNKPDLAKNKYNVKREQFDELNEGHVKFFKKLLGENRMVTDQNDLAKYNQDWMNQVRGYSSLALKPKTTEEVSRILSYCNDNNLAVCSQGGNTGIVAGATPIFDEIVISTELMNEIISIDEIAGTIVCQAGCILEKLDDTLASIGLMVPLDLGAKGSCHIGGNISTNAGGFRLFKYGNLHGNTLGLEVVTANGTVIDCLNTLKKDNTGYHLKHLFIGSEGTLGFVTKVAIQCVTEPKSLNVAFLGFQNFDKVLKAFRKAKEDLGEIMSACEVIDAEAMVFNAEKLNVQSPIGEYPFYLLIETSGSNEKHDSEKLNGFLETALNKHLALNGTVASESKRIHALWSVRESIPLGFKKTTIFSYDVSLPLENYFKLVDDMRIHMSGLSKRVFGFGHLGDGNLHLQIEVKEYNKEVHQHIEPFIFTRTKQLNGSISAEHGMGFLKAKYLDLARPANTVTLMKELKALLDPNGILNPYKMFTW